MSIIISGIRLPFDLPEEQAIEKAYQLTGLQKEMADAAIHRVSIDPRRGQIHRVYSVCMDMKSNEKAFAEHLQMPFVRYRANETQSIPCGKAKLSHRPVVVGLGPAGLFAAYTLAKYGYAPIVLERGASLEKRDQDVSDFWNGGKLNQNSNIQFGEGGAGAYSDGKLTTRIGDALCDSVLKTFVSHGAPIEITKQAKPHIGTDILKNIVCSMRMELIQNGGEVQFQTALSGVSLQDGKLRGIATERGDMPCERMILAVGHSARDTFFTLHQNGVYFEPKPFSVGVRIEHLQKNLDAALYGKHAGHPMLPPAEYSLSRRVGDRACYSFCMCPGGQVVAAQSEEDTVVTNGMSYHARNGKNGNSALAVSVNPEDFADGTPFGGIAFQREIERKAFLQTTSYRAPCQKVSDFLADKASSDIGEVAPSYPIGVSLGKAAESLPAFAQSMLKESLPYFGRKMRGFDAADALLIGPETRTSSPVRIKRGEDLFGLSSFGLIPCGEGAGYAGGIMSAAVDGIRAAYRIMEEFAPFLA